MFFIFRHLGWNRGCGSPSRHSQQACRKPSSGFKLPVVLLLIFGLVILQQPRFGSFLFFLIPFFFFWFLSILVSAIFKSLSKGVRVIEEYWTDHLGDESTDIPIESASSSDLTPPSSVAR